MRRRGVRKGPGWRVGIVQAVWLSAIGWQLVVAASSARATGYLPDPTAAVYYSVVGAAGQDLKVDKNGDIVGDLHANEDVVLKQGVLVTGDVSAIGSVSNQGSVTGTITPGASAVVLPALPTEAEARALADRIFEGNTSFGNGEVIDDIVFVDGDARFYGSLNGTGAVIAMRDIRLMKGGGTPAPSTQLTLVAHGDIRLDKQREFRGVLVAGEDIEIKKEAEFEGVAISYWRLDVDKESQLTAITLDAQPPTISDLTPSDGAVVAATTALIGATLDDELSGVDLSSVTLVVDGSDVTGSASVAPAAVTFTATDLAEGPHTVSLGLDDVAGNSTSASWSFSVDLTGVDTVPPLLEISVPGEPVVFVDPGIRVDYSDEGSGIDVDELLIQVDGSAITAQCAVGGAGAVCPPGGLSEGQHEISARIRDLAGNETVATQTFDLDLDTSPPTISASLVPQPNAAGWNKEPVTVQFQCSDGESQVTCPEDVVLTQEGAGQVVSRTAVDAAGNAQSTSVTVNIDLTSPELGVSFPPTGYVTNLASIPVEGQTTDANGVAEVDIDGVAVASGSGPFAGGADLADGPNTIVVTAVDVAGNLSTTPIDVTLLPVPQVTITSPVDGDLFSSATVDVSGSVGASVSSVSVNGVPAPVSGGSFLAPGVPLRDGVNLLVASAVGSSNTAANASVEVLRDASRPRIVIVTPSDGTTVLDQLLTVSGEVNDLGLGPVDSADVQVDVNGEAAVVEKGRFFVELPLDLGENLLAATATDQAGNVATAQATVTYDGSPGLSRLVLVSGNHQQGVVESTLAQPLVVRLVDGLGNPIGGEQVVFKVVSGDGAVVVGGQESRITAVGTDAQGEAQVTWRVGSRAGAGVNRVDARAVGYSGVARFFASGIVSNPARVLVEAGNNQIGVAGQELPYPFYALAVDAAGNRVPGAQVTFDVLQGGGSLGGEAGTSSLTALTDDDGLAMMRLTLGPEDGYDNNVVTASVPSGVGSPAFFVASGQTAGPVSQTQISGVVLDHVDQPIEGVEVSIHGEPQSVTTGPDGRFTLTATPVGRVVLEIDGSTAQRPGVWPTLAFELITVSGLDNRLDRPVYLLPLETENGVVVDSTTGGTVTLPDVPGFSLEVLPGSATFPDGSNAGTVSVTVVHNDKVPMMPSSGTQPVMPVTIQPPGVEFDPPARLTLPNLEGLPPGQLVAITSFDHDLGRFVPVGDAAVSEDGTVVQSTPGSGVVKGGWHYDAPPRPTATGRDCRVTILDSDPVRVAIDDPRDVFALGEPPGGSFSWQASTSDIAIVSVESISPDVSVATVVGQHMGIPTLEVQYVCPSGAAALDSVAVEVPTREFTAIAWVDGAPAEQTVAELRPDISLSLDIMLNNDLLCPAEMLNWLVGYRADIFSDIDRQYANAFLIANSGNAEPPPIVTPGYITSNEFRLYNRLQILVHEPQSPGEPPTVEYLARDSILGSTPIPCLGIGVSAQKHPDHERDNNPGLTVSGAAVYQLAEGRLGDGGQRIDRTLNNCDSVFCDGIDHTTVTGWIWNVIRLTLDGDLVPSEIDKSMFPAQYFYVDGVLVDPVPAVDVEVFTALDDSYQRTYEEIP